MIDKALRKQQISQTKRTNFESRYGSVCEQRLTDATIQEIAKACGFAVGTIYIYFPINGNIYFGHREFSCSSANWYF